MKLKPPNMALFIRTLTMDNRHWQGYAFRLALLAVIIFTLLQFSVMSVFSAQITAVGLRFFQTLANINLFFITLFGITLFSSAITEEKEIDSLNLLMMTGIGSFSMLISKSSSKMLVAMMLIVAQFPFTLLAVTLGGIGIHQIFCVYLTLLSYTIFVANIALFYSVISRKSAQAAILTFISLILFNSLTPIWKSTRFLSPFVRTNNILSTAFSGTAFGAQVWGTLLIALLFFLLSLILFNYFSRQSTASAPFRVPGSMHKSKFRLFKAGRSWNKALAWKEFHFCTGGVFGIILFSTLALAIPLIFFFADYFTEGGTPSRKEIGRWLIGLGLTFLFIEGVFLSSSLFSKEVWEKTHSSLMLLPMSVREIAYRKIAGGLIMMIPMAIFLLLGVILTGDEIFPNSIADISVFIATCFLWVAAIIFYYHLVTFFSLFVKYGAFAIAGLVFYMLVLLFLIPVMMLPIFGGLVGYSSEWVAVITMVISMAFFLFATFFLHRFIGKKLVVLAAA